MKKLFLGQSAFWAAGLVLAIALFCRVSLAGPPISPFPLNYPISFPWNSIEGIWNIVGSDTKSTFSFEVQSDCNGHQILKVYQIDPKSGHVIAEGTGNRHDDSTEVYAAMEGRGIQNYFVHIGAYMDRSTTPARSAVVVRMFSFGGGNTERDFEIQRVPGSSPIHEDQGTGSPTEPCESSLSQGPI